MSTEDQAEVASDLVQLVLPIPGLGVLSRRAAAAVGREHARRVSRALRRAEQLSGLTREEIEDALVAGSPSIHLVVRFLYAAGKNGHDHILDMMGLVLARGVRAGQAGDHGVLRDEELILIALESLQPEHIELLRHMSNTETKPSRWIIGNLADSLGTSTGAVEILLAGLQSAALVSVLSGFGTLVYEVSPVGLLVLRAADEIGSTDLMGDPGL